MGDLSEDVIDGLCCEICGIYFTDEHGFPVVCKSCWKEMSIYERKERIKATNDEL